jgi:hypothetical protein
MKTSLEPERSSALPNSHLDLIYYIGMYSPNSQGAEVILSWDTSTSDPR